MEDPLKVYNDVLKISGEAVANEVPFAGLTKNSTLTWTCPSCLQQIPWNDETMWSIKNMENIASDHLKSHGYSNEEISDIIDIDFQHLFRMDRIVGESVANKFNVGDYFIDDNNKYGKVLNILDEGDDYQFLDVQMTYGHRQKRSEFMKKVNPSDIGEEEKYAIDNSTGIFNESIANEVEIDEYDKDDIFQFLFDLRDSGVTNMFGSGSYVKEAFPLLTRKQVQEVVLEWMDNFEELRQRMGIESYASEEDGTDFDSDGDIDSEDYLEAKDRAIKKSIDEESYDSKHMDHIDGKYFNEQTSGQVWDNLDEISREAVLRATNFTFKMYDTPIFSHKHKIIDASSWELMNDSPESWKDLSETIDELYGSHMYSSTWPSGF